MEEKESNAAVSSVELPGDIGGRYFGTVVFKRDACAILQIPIDRCNDTDCSNVMIG